SESTIDCAFVDAASAGLAGEPSPDVLADFLVNLCGEVGARVVLLDGPQAWKDPGNGLEHSRICEHALQTPAKTGVPGTVKPRAYLRFVAFAIAVFDARAERGWSRYALEAGRNGGLLAVESFPMSAWKRLGIPTLPAKAKSRPSDLASRLEALRARLPLRLSGAP